MAGSRTYRILVPLLALTGLLVSGGPAGVRAAEAGEERGRTAELRIALPEGTAPNVSVTLAEGGVSVEVPQEAVFPLDFQAASGGLLRSGEVTRLGDDRRRVTLRLAAGLLDQVRYEPGAVVLRFRTRSQVVDPGDPADREGQYRLGPEDRLQISVNGQPEYTRMVTVSATGIVSAPLAGEVGAAGLTVDEFTTKLTDLLAQDYLVDPRVDVQVLEYRSQWVVVTGEVQRPGRISLRGGTELKEVLAETGGFSAEAGDEILISRRDLSTGETRRLSVDRAAFERGESAPRLEHGDLVNVPRARYCYVRGEVRTPRSVKVERGLTLQRVIALAGDLTEWANRRKVVVLKEGSEQHATAYDLDAIESGKAPDPEIEGGEVIIVKRRFF